MIAHTKPNQVYRNENLGLFRSSSLILMEASSNADKENINFADEIDCTVEGTKPF